MSEAQKPSDEFVRKWRNKSKEVYGKNFSKPLPRILWEKTVAEDEEFQAQGENFNLQASYIAWIEGWMRAELEAMKHNRDERDSWENKWNKKVRTPQEMEELKQKIDELTDTPPTPQGHDFYNHVNNDPTFIYLMNVADTLSWVLGEITTKDFLSSAHLNLEHWQGVRSQFIKE